MPGGCRPQRVLLSADLGAPLACQVGAAQEGSAFDVDFLTQWNVFSWVSPARHAHQTHDLSRMVPKIVFLRFDRNRSQDRVF